MDKDGDRIIRNDGRAGVSGDCGDGYDGGCNMVLFLIILMMMVTTTVMMFYVIVKMIIC